MLASVLAASCKKGITKQAGHIYLEMVRPHQYDYLVHYTVFVYRMHSGNSSLSERTAHRQPNLLKFQLIDIVCGNRS